MAMNHKYWEREIGMNMKVTLTQIIPIVIMPQMLVNKKEKEQTERSQMTLN